MCICDIDHVTPDGQMLLFPLKLDDAWIMQDNIVHKLNVRLHAAVIKAKNKPSSTLKKKVVTAIYSWSNHYVDLTLCI